MFFKPFHYFYTVLVSGRSSAFKHKNQPEAARKMMTCFLFLFWIQIFKIKKFFFTGVLVVMFIGKNLAIWYIALYNDTMSKTVYFDF